MSTTLPRGLNRLAGKARADSVSARPEAGAGHSAARYLTDHPLAYGLSLAGSVFTALYALAAAARPDRRHRAVWLALGAHCAAQSAGIVAATELTRRRAHASHPDQHGEQAA